MNNDRISSLMGICILIALGFLAADVVAIFAKFVYGYNAIQPIPELTVGACGALFISVIIKILGAHVHMYQSEKWNER